MEAPDEFARLADEIELTVLDLQESVSVSLLIEVLARVMARAEAIPDQRFLSVIQVRTMALLTEETGHEYH